MQKIIEAQKKARGERREQWAKSNVETDLQVCLTGRRNEENEF